MAVTQSTKPASGTRDFLADDIRRREHVIGIVRDVYERYGFEPLETPAFENIETLLGKYGEEGNKLIFKILKRGEHEHTGEADLALRYDLTVPLARVVAQYQNELPRFFKRYQIQPVWRADRPARGRFREFYQCDIDVIGRETLSYLAEAEIPSVIYSVFREMAIGAFRIRINNRKVLKGILRHFEVSDERSSDVLRALDKIDKEESGAVIAELERNGLAAKAARELYAIIGTKRETNETLALLGERGFAGEGLAELRQMVEAIRLFGVPDSAFAVDLSVVRGLDYYTGTIYETTLVDHPDIGSICSGGRYDDLASYFTNTKLPGVGISIGLSRLFARLKDANLLPTMVRTPAEVLVTTLDPESLQRYLGIAVLLRAQDINTEVYLERAKIGRQFEYANKKGFRIAITAGADEFSRGTVKVKDLAAQAQTDVPLGELAAHVKQLLDSKAH